MSINIYVEFSTIFFEHFVEFKIGVSDGKVNIRISFRILLVKVIFFATIMIEVSSSHCKHFLFMQVEKIVIP